DAGLQDAFALVGRGDGYTFASNDLYERIDYLWVTPDLQVSELVIPESTASDHLGVALTVGR
ncbi:MAG: endonuclease, partial [Chloroflexota bacterium]